MKRNTSTFEITLSSHLVALMLILGYIESTLPPVSGAIPGIKLGLSNGILIFAVYMLNIPLAYVLMVMKIVLSSLLFSGFQSFPYAFAGGLFSLTLMSLMRRSESFSPVVVSMLGGACHNIGQVAMAILIVHLPVREALFYAGILTLVGLACGCVTGLIAQSVMRHLKAGRIRLPEVKKSSGLPLQIISVLLILICIFFVYRSAQNNTSVTVTVSGPLSLEVPLPDHPSV